MGAATSAETAEERAGAARRRSGAVAERRSMAENLSRECVIAIAWGFDQTLSPDSVQPLFTRFGVDAKDFWTELCGVDFESRQGLRSVSQTQSYLNHILAYTKAGRFNGLTNRLLHELGSEIPLYDGLPGFFERLKATFEVAPLVNHGIRVEHYIISVGLTQMIQGSRIAPYVNGVWGCEFDESPTKADRHNSAGPLFEAADPTIRGVGHLIESTTKPRLLVDISTGAGKCNDIARGGIPFHNILYVAGSQSSLDAFNTVNQYGGRTFAVYEPSNAAHFQSVQQLQLQNRVH